MSRATATSKTETTGAGAASGTVIYEGVRAVDGVMVTRRVEKLDGTTTAARPLSPRFDLRNHSPTGFEWGYGGSGPAQLALALLADALNDAEQALLLYQTFKWKTVAGLPQDSWQMTAAKIQQIAHDLRAGQGVTAQQTATRGAAKSAP